MNRSASSATSQLSPSPSPSPSTELAGAHPSRPKRITPFAPIQRGFDRLNKTRLEKQLFNAVKDNRFSTANHIIQKEVINCNQRAKHGGTPLGLAAENGNLDIVRALLQRKDIDCNMPVMSFRNLGDVVKFQPKYTPLYQAVHNGHYDVVCALLQAPGIDPNRVGNYFNTPLCLAIEMGRKDIVRALLETPGIDCNKAGEDRKTPLEMAARRYDDETVWAILKSPGINYEKITKFSAPLEVALRKGDDRVVHALLKASGTRRVDLYSSICIAVEAGNTSIAQALLEKENSFYKRPNWENLSLHYAIKDRKTEVVRALLTCSNLDLSRKWQEQTVLDVAVAQGDTEIITMLRTAIDEKHRHALCDTTH